MKCSIDIRWVQGLCQFQNVSVIAHFVWETWFCLLRSCSNFSVAFILHMMCMGKFCLTSFVWWIQHINCISTNRANSTSCVVTCASLLLCNCDFKLFPNFVFCYLYHRKTKNKTDILGWAMSSEKTSLECTVVLGLNRSRCWQRTAVAAVGLLTCCFCWMAGSDKVMGPYTN